MQFDDVDIDIFYRLFEQSNPFPLDAFERLHPLTFRFAQTLARGMSLHTGAMLTILLVRTSSLLNSVKSKYSGILGIFANLNVVVFGATGDGKSIGVWFMSQVVLQWQRLAREHEKKRWRKAKKEFEKWIALPSAQQATTDRPADRGREPHINHLFRKGSLSGLAQNMQSSRGRALIVKHEGKKLFQDCLKTARR